MSSDPVTPEQQYTRRAAQFAKQADELGSKVASIANLRGISFAAALVLSLVAAFGRDKDWAVLATVPCVALFVVSVIWHGRVIAAWEIALRWWYVNEHGRLRVGAQWRSLPDQGEGLVPSGHPYAADLDLFGPSSLFQRCNVAHTRFGQQLLARWLCEPDGVLAARRRQTIVRKLATDLELRQELEARTLSLSLPRVWTRADVKPLAAPDPEPLLNWAESMPLPRFSAARVWLLRGLTALTVTTVLMASLLPLPKWTWLVPLCLQIVIVFRYRDVVAQMHHRVSLGQGVFMQYGPTLQLLQRCVNATSELTHLRERVTGSEPQAAMSTFARWVGWLELRTNPLVHPVANAVLLWDVHCLIALEGWQRSWGSKVRGWFNAVGELEALSSLAGIAHDNPSYAWPELSDDQPHFEATSLAHPLIEADVRVGNSVSLARPGTALLVTGSNMSGKSTLLRAMGLAQVMALAGAPVCAQAFRSSGLMVRTSLRISDSLEQGVSHFYAELGKLKAAVDTARSSSRVLFLLDEILHGTNSLERQVGARWVLGELLQTGSIGAVSTHDTGLCQLSGDLMHRVTQVHLRETVVGERMTFDYLLRPGPVQGGNALRLMRTLGLDVPLDSQS